MLTTGFFGGAVLPFAGFAFLARRPALWGYALVPATLACVVFFASGAASLYWLHGSLWPRLEAAEGWTTLTWGLAYALSMLVGLLLSFVVALGLAQPLAGPALETIVRRVHEAEGANVPTVESSFATEALRSLRVNLFGLLVGLPFLLGLSLVTVFVPPLAPLTFVLKFLVSAAIAAWDLLDYPLSPEGYGIRQRLAWMRTRKREVLGFGCTSALMLLLPLVGLLVLPAGVVGATLLAIRTRRTA